MGAIFFYIFIYFIGYYASNVLNMVTVRPLVTNRYMAALVPVYGFAFGHAYMVVTKPLPAGADISMEYALLVFITLPVVVVTMGAAYFMWNSKGKEEHSDNQSAANNQESTEAVTAEAAGDSGEARTENPAGAAGSSETPSAADSAKNKDSKDA
ncbi:hypothetical protein [Nitrosomonas oligotropha]|uniref:Uncharacterized protein n=1 Tax=Nitrosomonas oligotropha TaxID=42354 RepID=A0A1H8Q4W7_9PROT|nr:hypothetical protein [Nitrosomonas oligotropha]SDW69294.1 hypothetical protein SAMN05216300_1094 [Nitrosomonas oligotropha]SEO49106.1 hypothetical protein SAMN05216333_1114 [Nitrosomonas oligotropha]